MTKITAAALAAFALTAGCASMGTKFDPAAVASLQPGMTKDEVFARLGKPNGTAFMPDGREIDSWVYSHANGLTGSANARTASVIFGADGRLIRVGSVGQTGTN